MSNEVKILITAKDASKPVLAGVADGLEDVETASDKAGNGLKGIDRQLSNLDRQVLASRLELKRLAHEFSNVDDEAQKIDISSAMDRVQKDIARSLKVKDALKFSDLIPSEPDGPAIGKFTAGLGKISSLAAANVGPMLGSSIGIAAAPLLASTLAGGIIGGVGIGGVVGGVAVAAQDPRVKGEFKTLGDGLKDRLKDAGKGFLAPTIQSIGIIKKSLDTIDVESIFKDTSKYVVPLAEGIGGALEGLGNGLEDVAKNAGPSVKAIADGIEGIGESIGEGLSSLADNGDTAAESLSTVLTATTNLLDATFMLVNAGMETKEFFDEFLGGALAFDSGLRLLNLAFEDGTGTMTKHKAGAEGAAEGLGEIRDAAEESAVSESKLAAAIKEVDDALHAQQDPVFALINAQNDLAESQEKVRKAVKKYGEGSKEANEATRELAEKALGLDDAVKDLGGSFDGKMTPALRNTLRAAGLTEGQIKNLAGQFRGAKRTGDDFARSYVAKLRVDGYPTVYRQLYSVKDAVNDIPRAVNIAMRITGVTSVSAAAAAVRKNGGYAHGGIVGAAANGATSSGLTLVGEQGPELAEIAPGGRVWSNPDTRRMLSGGMGGGQEQQPQVIQLIVDGKVLAESVVEPLRGKISRQASGDAQKYWGRAS